MSILRRTLALGAFFVAVAVLTACGGGVPGNSVATVGDQTLKKSTFEHWMRIAAISSAGQQNPTASQPPKVSIPDAENDFKSCIAEKRKSTPPPAKGQAKPTDAQFKQQCQQQYDQLKNQVMSFLLRATWLDQEAQKQGVKVADKDVQKQLDTAKKQAFPKDADYQKYLVRNGLTNADVLFQQRSQLLEQKITQKVTKGKDKVSDAQIQQYYDKNKSRFATPERRDLRIVLTRTKAKADEAKKALQSGQSWSAVAKKYSIDPTSKTNGGKLAGVAKGQQEKALDDAVFKAPKGRLSGPVRTQFGWYVFTVDKVSAADQQSLEQSKKSITDILKSENSQKALTNFGKDYRKRYKDQTDCRKQYVTQDCKNGKAPKQPATTTPPAGQQQPGQTTTQR
jgi:foldase protein PrsA